MGQNFYLGMEWPQLDAQSTLADVKVRLLKPSASTWPLGGGLWPTGLLKDLFDSPQKIQGGGGKGSFFLNDRPRTLKMKGFKAQKNI